MFESLEPPLFVGLLSMLGLLVGSFLNVVVHRLPLMLQRLWWVDATLQLEDGLGYRRVFGHEAPEAVRFAVAELERGFAGMDDLDLLRPASRCPHCGHRIRWWENIPVISWIALRGRCSACHARISIRYPAVEIATMALFAAIAWRFGPGATSLLWCGFAAVLLAAWLIDWDSQLLPDALTLPLMWAGLIFAAIGLLPGLTAGSSVGGAALGYLVLWGVSKLFYLVRGVVGMANGDFKLLAAIGAWLGGWAILPVLLLSCAIGLVLALLFRLRRSQGSDHYFPFGPALAIAGLVAMFLGVEAILSVIGWGAFVRSAG